MAIDTLVAFPVGDTSGYLNIDDGVGGLGYNYASLFTGLTGLMIGSSFQVEEILTISIAESEPQLISRDFRYPIPKAYYGYYQFTNGSPGNAWIGEDGLISAPISQFRRYSDHTVIANVAQAGQLGNIFVMDDCNFALQIASASIPPFTAGLGYLVGDLPVFRGREIYYPSQLLDRPFYSLFQNFAYKLNPGAELSLVRYQATPINFVETADPQTPNFTCNVATQCQLEFAAFLNTIGTSYNFATLSELNVAFPGANYTTSTFVSPTDPIGCNILYYSIIPN